MVFSPILKRLLFVNQFSINKGRISLLGSREVMLNASAILELQNLDKTKLYSIGKESGLKNIKGIVDHANVYKKIKNVFIGEIASLGKKIGQTDEGTLRTLQELFNVFGLGEMNIENIDNVEKKSLVVIKDCVIVEEWISQNKGKSKSTVCALTAGILAGVFSYIFGKEVDCVETDCKAKGAPNCLFEVG